MFKPGSLISFKCDLQFKAAIGRKVKLIKSESQSVLLQHHTIRSNNKVVHNLTILNQGRMLTISITERQREKFITVIYDA